MPSVAISASASGANELVAAAGAGKIIRVHSYIIVAAGTVAVKFQSASTDLTGAMPMVANEVIEALSLREPWFDTAPNEALNLNLSTNVAVTGHLVYSIH